MEGLLMAKEYELSIKEIDNLYKMVADYNISKEDIEKLISRVETVKKGELFSPPNDCLCLLLDGALYSFEELPKNNEQNSIKIKCLISNNLYDFMFAPVEYCDEAILSKITFQNTKYNNSNNIKLKASVNSNIMLINLEKLKEIDFSSLMNDYYIKYSINSKKYQEIIQLKRNSEKRDYINKNFKIANDFNNEVLANFFGFSLSSWNH